MPKKFKRCVEKVKKQYPKGEYNPYAVCRVSTGYKGTTHDIGLIHKKLKKKKDLKTKINDLLKN